MKYCASIFILALLMLAPLSAHAGSEEADTQFVRIMPVAEVDQPLITLLQLADQQKPMGAELRERLGRTTVGAAPELGSSFYISGIELRRLVNEANLPAGISVLLPDRVQVKRASVRLGRQELMEIYEEALRQEVRGQDLELVVLDVNTGADITLPGGQFDYSAKRLGSRWGRVTVLVDFFVNGRRQAQTRITGNVEVYGQALVAARSLPAGHVLTPEDISTARISMSEAGVGAVGDPKLVVGQRLRSPVGMGNLLDPRRMQQEILVRSGDIVNMICINPNISLSTKGRVEQNGYMNSVIKLTNLSSKRPVFGRVVDAGTVVVEF